MPNNITTGQALVGATLAELGNENMLSQHSLYDDSTIAFIGGQVLDNGILSNTFLPTLMNKICKTMIDVKIYDNPFKEFKQGDFPDGIGIEDVFVNPINPIEYQSGYNVDINGNITGYADQYALFEPDVKTVYYTLNSTKVFPITVKTQELRTAFASWDSFQAFVDRIVSVLTNSVYIYEFKKTKELLSKALVLEHAPLTKIQCLPINDIEFATDYVEKCRAISLKMGFASINYNNWNDYASQITNIDEKRINTNPVETFTKTEDLRLIQLADITTKCNVQVLATAFNIAYTEFNCKLTNIDDWLSVDIEEFPTDAVVGQKYHTDGNMCRYDYLDEDGNRHHVEYYGIICDKHFVQIWDNYNQLTNATNSLSLYTNYFKHLGQIYSLCPFANAVALYSDIVIPTE